MPLYTKQDKLARFPVAPICLSLSNRVTIWAHRRVGGSGLAGTKRHCHQVSHALQGFRHEANPLQLASIHFE